MGVINGDRKEIVKVSRQLVQIYDLAADPGELNTLASVDASALGCPRGMSRQGG